jgi:hypothetical protein
MKSQNVYDAILARSKRSRMEKQPNGYASVQDPVSDYTQEYRSKQKDTEKQRKPMQTPFSHSMLIAVKRNVSPERDHSPI